ncbi:hypothetical protein KI688_007923 [Linnemannia hyalina]|uniref:Piwi domain-containing protein n=1 Tax=Linnemannia hyalina TaxID=64524 RepID=A0A9P7XJ07_9FUNG|nr:hypothetical protein KI688_007923 [Linnemannia hyalina]
MSAFIKLTELAKSATSTNFFELETLPNINIHHQDVTITSRCQPPINRRIIDQFVLIKRDGRTSRAYSARPSLPALVITNHPSSRDAKTKKKPERILLYLNRVSEGQFVQVHQVEVDAIRSASKKLQVTYAPKCHFCPKAARPQVPQVMRK